MKLVLRFVDRDTRGLALDIIRWVFNQYSISTEVSSEELDGYRDILVPFMVHVGRHVIRYKRAVVKFGRSSASKLEQIEGQVRSALFYQPQMREEYKNQVLVDREAGYPSDASDSRDDPPELYDLDINMQIFTVNAHEIPINNGVRTSDLLLDGQTISDRRLFAGLSCEFDLDKYGTMTISSPSLSSFFFFVLVDFLFGVDYMITSTVPEKVNESETESLDSDFDSDSDSDSDSDPESESLSASELT
jgi:hypothetical protein